MTRVARFAMKCLGLDLGSSSVKGAVLDLERGEVRGVIQEPFPPPVTGLPKGRFEIDPQAMVAAAERVLSRLIPETPDATAVFCSGQMGGVILTDASGAALTNYLSWRDQRTLEPHGGGNYLDAIRARWTGSELLEIGNELPAGSATGLMFWLAENQQLPPNATPASAADYVLGRLCNAPPQMDVTQALGLLNLRSGDFHRAAFDRLGLDKVVWPKQADPREPIGVYKSLNVHAAFGDQQAALRGAGLARNELSLNISTGSQVSRRTAAFEPGGYQTRRYFDGDFLNTITHLPAGRSLNVLCDLLTELARAQGVTLANPWDYIARAAADADGGGLEANLAFFAGPLGSRGSLRGITTENLTVGNLFHAAFRAMAENYSLCADRLCPDRAGLQLVLSGGMTRGAPILRRLIEERFPMPLRESAAVEETLLGLLSIAREVYSPG